MADSILKQYLKNSFFISIFIVALQTKVLAQTDVFKTIDAHSLSIQNNKDPKELTKELIAPAKNETEKVRAIFRWIAGNIAYDTKEFHKPQKTQEITYSSKEELEQLLKEQDYKNAVNTLKKKKGVCHDYAILFKLMCQYAGIESKIVEGYSRQDPNGIGKKSYLDHAWNVVKIDNRWYLFDVTWAAGFTNDNITKFTKDFNDFYFMTSPFNFVLHHYPEDKQWLLLEVDFSYDKFNDQVFIYSHKLLPHFDGINPTEGTLKKGKDAEISITLSSKISELSIQNSSMKYPETLTFSKGCCDLIFTIPKANMKGKHIEIIIDGEYFARYNLK